MQLPRAFLNRVKVEDVNVYEAGLYTYLDTDAAGSGCYAADPLHRQTGAGDRRKAA